jgi:hypothetical protein
VSVWIDPARGDDHPAGVDGLRGPHTVTRVADENDAVTAYRDIGLASRAAGAIDYRSAANQNIGRDLLSMNLGSDHA